MSNERIIHHADLSRIESSLNGLQVELLGVSHQVSVVDNNVQVVHQEVTGTQQKLDALTKEFHDFVRKDMLFKELQLAETRIVKIRQEIKSTYGHYDEVRRRVTGILQAVDVRLVKKETIENATEELMLAAPRYWLAPCLIALAAWLNDNKDLADRAMMEALKRDDEKTSLFFALVTRRGARYKASRQWLDRYFGLQDPYELEREVVILIDGFTNGIFGPESRIQIDKRIDAWIEELSEQAGFVEEQSKQWRVAMEAKIKKLDEEAYPYLRQYSQTWPQLEESLKGAKLHNTIHDYFSNILNRQITPHASIAIAVDALLDTLVTQFDSEELPLRKEERLQTLIIEEQGDRNTAQIRFNAEKALEEKISFTQLLTNFAMNPEVSHSTLASQKYAIALSKDWIRQAHDDMTLDNRMKVPPDIHIEIDSWSGITKNGDNEQELMEDLSAHMEKRKNAELSSMRLSFWHWLGLALGILAIPAAFAVPILFAGTIAGVVYFTVNWFRLRKAKEQLVEDYAKLLAHCQEILRAVLSDAVDWRREYASEDGKAAKVTELLGAIEPDQYAFANFDTARRVL
ncbi:hypothetical protein [Paenibacillus sp. YN15]|uniref:hypothetical protein n=1 Tax=Paenibacillus sp. YN15 TaxID=1742774 RepID=UPI000DCDDE99|nr:hypothetical protein [Paenibacillus sp. YN15]RAV04172.1 hypothetical protein DQG13_06760 [Paenibacillus sp. YN15]